MTQVKLDTSKLLGFDVEGDAMWASVEPTAEINTIDKAVGAPKLSPAVTKPAGIDKGRGIAKATGVIKPAGMVKRCTVTKPAGQVKV